MKRRYTLRDIVLVVEVLLLLMYLRFLLSFKGLRGILSLVKSSNVLFACNQNRFKNIRGIQLAAKLIPKCTCLIKATAFKMISPDNEDMCLVIGISKKQYFQSHAWVELDQQIIFGATKNQDYYKPILAIH